MNRKIIGIAGRSGSGKTTLVKDLLQHFGTHHLTLHTMDNYYLPRHEQVKDESNYLNFDLPSSFYRYEFHEDLLSLSKGKQVRITEYVFNNESDKSTLTIHSAPMILVEGLFIYHYPEISRLINTKIFIDLPFNEAYRRRLRRDKEERNYTEEEIRHRYMKHAEPAYQSYIAPHMNDCDLVLSNHSSPEDSLARLVDYIMG